jgi:hypothetical protein
MMLTLVTACAVSLSACVDGNGGGNASPTTPVPATTSPAPTGLPTAEPTDGPTVGPSTGPSWSSGPVMVTHNNPAPPVPLLVGIRTAAHPDGGFDRIVFDFSGPLPGYTIRYVDEVRADPSDLPISMPGRRYLLVVFTVAQAHSDAGEPSVSPKSATFDYPMLRGFVIVGDFEGYVSVALGLDDVVGYRVGELAAPNRIYIDVAA